MAEVEASGSATLDHYQRLGVPQLATQQEIRAAYKRLSLLYHPDKARLDASTCFTAIKEAYECLSDPARRLLYDVMGAFSCLKDSLDGAAASTAPAAAGPASLNSSHSSSFQRARSHSPDTASWPVPAPVHPGAPSCAAAAPAAVPPLHLHLGAAEALAAASHLQLSPTGPCGAPASPLMPPAPPLGVLGKRKGPSLDASLSGLSPAPPPQPQHPLRPQHSLGSASGSCPRAPPAALPPQAHVQHVLLLTLEEMYCGCTKQLTLSRRVYRPQAQQGAGAGPGALQQAASAAASCASFPGGCPPPACAVDVEEVFRVVVAPGWREGMRVTFPGKGNEVPPTTLGPSAAPPSCPSPSSPASPCSAPLPLAGDMVLLVAQAAHGRFVRRGHDLFTRLRVRAEDALAGAAAQVATLDGRRVTLQLGPFVLQPACETVVVGEGMPIPPGSAAARRRAAQLAGGPGGAAGGAAGPVRGDLHVRFEVAWPAGSAPELRPAAARH